MNRSISRRDFLNGVALTVGSALIPSSALAFDEAPYAPEKARGSLYLQMSLPLIVGFRQEQDALTFS